MRLEQALPLLRDGQRIRRADASWRSAQHCIYVVKGSVFNVNRAPLNQHYPEGTQVTYAPHVDAVFTDRSCGVYNLTNADIFAHDWEVDDTPLT